MNCPSYTYEKLKKTKTQRSANLAANQIQLIPNWSPFE
jgi:hypothetical protein